MKQLKGNIVDIFNRRIFPATLIIEKGIIKSIEENTEQYDSYILPGFIDAHVHIESSMLLPVEFSKLVIQNGTTAIINDPHEIANVLGKEGIEFMIENSKEALIKTFFTIPSCVPATPFDCSGSEILSSDVEELAKSNRFVGLSEFMNVPGVLAKDPEVKNKIETAQKFHLVIDGHAPGLKGKDLKQYIQAGISTDHECTTYEEALEKIQNGMKILIREGSAAKNYEALKKLISECPDDVMFCTDDSHPGDLIQFGHIDKMVKKAIEEGNDLFDVLKIACINPVQHYQLQVGMLRVNDSGDFIVIKDLKEFEVLSVYIDGIKKFDKKENSFFYNSTSLITPDLNHFNRKPIPITALKKSVSYQIVAIKVYNNEIVTDKVIFPVSNSYENYESDISRDILKIVYLNRYQQTPPQIAYITGVGLKKGAFATSISHDSHHILAVGCNDHDLNIAINTIISQKGGLCVAIDGEISVLSLPVAGIMSTDSGEEIARQWDLLISKLKENGCKLDSPFMTLSFMSLIVIPELKIGEKGLFDYNSFCFLKDESR